MWVLYKTISEMALLSTHNTIEPWHVISNTVAFWQVQIQTRLCSLFLNLENPNDVQSVAQHS